jgi:hypothetical protein
MYKRIIFWRAAGCFKSACAILDVLEDPDKPLTLKGTNKPLFIRALENSKYGPNKDDYLINWGNGGYATFPELKDVKEVAIINNPSRVNIATNKIKTFEALDKSKVRTLKWTTSKSQAEAWSKEDKTVIARKTIDGCCGEGIIIIEAGQPVPTAPLYTVYKKKTSEFRVHVFKGTVIDVVQKKLKKGKKSDGKIRNVDDGWVFCHENIEEPNDLRQLGIDAIDACGLDFGAVDIIWNKHYNKCYVLEVNTAPGLELTPTIKAYARAFLKDINNG